MMVDTTIYGYYHEGEQVCPSCVPVSDETNEPSTDWVPMYSSDDDSPYGTDCDKCYATIFEPASHHPGCVTPDADLDDCPDCFAIDTALTNPDNGDDS